MIRHIELYFRKGLEMLGGRQAQILGGFGDHFAIIELIA